MADDGFLGWQTYRIRHRPRFPSASRPFSRIAIPRDIYGLPGSVTPVTWLSSLAVFASSSIRSSPSDVVPSHGSVQSGTRQCLVRLKICLRSMLSSSGRSKLSCVCVCVREREREAYRQTEIEGDLVIIIMIISHIRPFSRSRNSIQMYISSCP